MRIVLLILSCTAIFYGLALRNAVVMWLAALAFVLGIFFMN